MNRKLRVALFLDNKGFSNFDISSPDQGNPGIGGTEYNFITFPYYYIKYFDDIDFTYFCSSPIMLNDSFEIIYIDNLTEAAHKARELNFDFFIYRPVETKEGAEIISVLDTLKLKSIAWAHNTPFSLLRKLASSNFTSAYLCVAHEQYDMLRDHPIFSKSTYIYNGFDPSIYKPNNKSIKKDISVVYIGSLVPAKGFHVLAMAWKAILKRVPNAKLHVIGSGNLYNHNSELGPLGVADKTYEDSFIPYISDDHGLLGSVIFHGRLGSEKIPIIQNALVGCPNPSGRTENCPGSAIEIQACGTAIVSGKFWGLLDTVNENESGFLVETLDELVLKITSLLLDPDTATKMGADGIRFIEKRFSHAKISKEWNQLFYELSKDKAIEIKAISTYKNYEYKKLSEKLRVMKNGNFNFLPTVIEFRKYINFLKRLSPLSKNKINRL